MYWKSLNLLRGHTKFSQVDAYMTPTYTLEHENHLTRSHRDSHNSAYTKAFINRWTQSISNNIFQCTVQCSKLHGWNYSPSTAKMRVLVKCLYRESLTMFLLMRKVRVVCTRDMKIHQQIAESSTARGILAINCPLLFSALCWGRRKYILVSGVKHSNWTSSFKTFLSKTIIWQPVFTTN